MCSLSCKRTFALCAHSSSLHNMVSLKSCSVIVIMLLAIVSFSCAAQSPDLAAVPFESHVPSPLATPISPFQPTSAPSPTSQPIISPDSAEQKLEASKVPLNIAFAGLALYSLIGLLTLVAMIFPPQRVTPTRQSQIVQRLFSVLVILFCIIRLVYFCFPIAHVTVTVTYVVNQIAFMVFFTMFSLIIFFWAEQYHRKFFDTQSMLPRLRNVFIIANLALWVLEIILVTLSVVFNQVPQDRVQSDPSPTSPLAPTVPSSLSPIVTLRIPSMMSSTSSPSPLTPILTPSTSTKGANVGGPVYFASVILVIVVDFIFALGFAIYGIAIFFQKYTHSLGSGLRREMISTMIVTIVFACCFALRMIMFLYRPVTGKFLNPILYRVLAYFVPEVVAVLLQVSVVYLMNHSASGSNGGWKRGPRNTGSIQRPSIDDDVYYAADQDLRASAMPAPLANAHQRLISPPRPLRSNFSSTGAMTGTASSASSSIQSNTAQHNSLPATSQLPTTTSTTSTATSPPSSNPTSINPLHSGLPMAIATHQNTRIGSPLHSASPRSFTPASFSPGHDQPLAQTSSRLPLQHLDNDNDHDFRDGEASDDSESIEIDPTDTASLLSPTRKAPRRY
jgi:hypothetical protein